jgi:RpiB/LacA/LacB family sugar-phosphate isomerase
MPKYNLLIPMAGMGQRFLDAGYNVPKQFIYCQKNQLIDISLDCFDKDDCKLIFIVRDDQIANYSVDKLLREKYCDYDIEIVSTEGLTKGSVCSCLLARNHIDNDIPLFIHTLDIEFKPHIKPAQVVEGDCDGLIFTFKSNCDNYSYALVENGFVKKTAEKKVISDEACVGIYYFRSGSIFCSAAEEMIEKDLTTKGEFYISPLYNILVENKLRIKTKPVEKMYIFGTPSEFEFYKNNVTKSFTEKPIALCGDHSGFHAKQQFKNILKEKQIQYIDFGTFLPDDCDYRYFIKQAVNSKNEDVCDFIFGFCRTGQGVNMCANKFKGVRSALIYDKYSAEMAIRHNCANFFSFPSSIFLADKELASETLDIIFNNTFDGGRHQLRVQELENGS